MFKKNVDQILRDLDFKYAYNLGRKEKLKKINSVSFGVDYHSGKLSLIEELYCEILGVNALDKTGKSLIRHLKKKTKRNVVYNCTKKK